ncbi:MAG: hypothetical protein WCH52_06380 [Bacteroidota bacterium]
MKNKFLLAFLATVSISLSVYSQDQDNEKFFKKENVFTGGTLNAVFGNQITALGISPYIGYSFNKYVDIAVSPSINYQSQRDYIAYGDKLRLTNYGPGAFIRLFPFKFLFAEGHYEYNFLRTKYIPFGSTGGLGVERFKLEAHSFLVGGGISSGKDFPYQKSYYYFSILWDIANSPYSPYKDNLQRSVPIIRAGYNIALFQGKK